jgi:hypothetical protein
VLGDAVGFAGPAPLYLGVNTRNITKAAAMTAMMMKTKVGLGKAVLFSGGGIGDSICG